MTDVSATVGEEISESVNIEVSCRCPPPTILPFSSLNSPVVVCFGVRKSFDGMGLVGI